MSEPVQRDERNRRVAWSLAGVVAAMFAFGYVLVPLYDVFCELTGLNGKTGRIAAGEVTPRTAVAGRSVTVEFVANVNGNLPWKFRPLQPKLRVPVGVLSEASFFASNLSGDAVTGQAVPSVSPGQAAKYFNKTECFCFTNQTLGPGEGEEMAVRFVVDPDLPEHVKTVTLSYTFFETRQSAALREVDG
jgi:cytochrome c oxidase assembly protein subunit 11